MKAKLLPALLLAGLLICLPAVSTAAPIQAGELRIAGLADAVVGQTFLNFLCSGNFGACPADYGDIVRTGVTGDFAVAGTTSLTGFIHSLDQAGQPIGEAFSLPNFIIFDPTADVALDLTFIFTGASGQAQCAVAPAPGQVCTPALPALVTASNPLGLTPYNLQNTQTGSTASFSVAGQTRRLSTNEVAPFRGVFTAQFSVPYQAYLPTILAGGTVQNSYSATFAAEPVPEPATTALMLGGLALVAGGYLRRKREVR